MANQNTQKLALISVTDKTGIIDFAKGLTGLNFKIISTGGTAKTLREAHIPVVEVSEYAGTSEIFSGRVKTLHPKIFGGILFDRNNPTHVQEARDNGILPIDLVVVNLYQFEKNAVGSHLDLSKAIEFIDIGGPSLLRAAAKNYQNAAPVIDPFDYRIILEELAKNGSLSTELRIKLARKVFSQISSYDSMISDYYYQFQNKPEALPDRLTMNYKLYKPLRYGENPHQKASLYVLKEGAGGFSSLNALQGKELSYNNLVDLDAAISLVADFSDKKALAIIKHTNPCGAAVSSNDSLSSLYRKALDADPKSAFGGIIATNQTIDAETAHIMRELFVECIAAPGFSNEARELFSSKKNLRLLEVDFSSYKKRAIEEELQLRSIHGALLVQTTDTHVPSPTSWKVVTKRPPSQSEADDLVFAMIVSKHVKSNAIVYAKNQVSLGVGAGQMSRIDSATFAAQKCKEFGKDLRGAVMGSDAFFPFRDNVDFAASLGITAIIQPGGSVRDQESIDACNEHGITMVFTGMRHFKH